MATLNIIADVGIISVNNPPMNALNKAWRQQFPKCFLSALNNDKISAIVICGSGKNFSVGADVTEFSDMDGLKLFEFIDFIEKSNKPVIAAIHGYAFGGGLEIALACHYRIALSSAKFGFPEVKIGLLPGAGGTQRFPRLVGLSTSLEWIVYGKEHGADEALRINLIDRICYEDSDITKCAMAFAHEVAGISVDDRRLSTKSVPDAAMADDLLKHYKPLISLKSRGALAPLACLEATYQSAKLSYQLGMLNEQKALKFLVDSGQVNALVYVFHAERFAKKWHLYDSVLTGVKPSHVSSVAVIGLGTMGRGIAISLLRSGFEKVFVLELNSKALVAGINFIKSIVDRDFKKGIFNESRKQLMLKALVPVAEYEKLKDVDLVIEAVFESMSVKKQVFAKLDQVCKSSAILASNTSALDIDEIASSTSRPQQVVGMHFFAPAHVMKLLENVRGSASSPLSVATAMKVGERLNKITVLVGNCHGFVGNRMFGFYTSESDFILEEGAYPQEVDDVLKRFGFAMGRYQVADLSGNDIGYKIRGQLGMVAKDQPLGTSERERFGRRYCPLSDILVESGRLGYKSGGKGWFTYVGKERKLTVDPVVTKMIDDYRSRNDITPRSVPAEEIIERMLYPLINEGFNILEEGIASNPSTIDLVFIYGYGWPRHTGGPMYYAHTVGLPRILEVINRHWEASGKKDFHWQPSKMLIRLVEEHGNPDIVQWMALSPMKSSL